MKVFTITTPVTPETPEECYRMCSGDMGIVCNDALSYLTEIFQQHRDCLSDDEQACCRCTATERVSIAGDFDQVSDEYRRQLAYRDMYNDIRAAHATR